MTTELGSARSIRRLTGNYYTLVVAVSMVDFVFGAAYVFHMTRVGVSPSLIGVLLSIAGVVSFLLEVPSGILADRLGNKRVLVMGLVLWGISQCLFGLSSGVLSVVVSVLLLNVALAFYSGAPISYTINALKRAGGEHRIDAVSVGGASWRWVGAALGGTMVFASGAWLGGAGALAASGGVLLVAAIWVNISWQTEPTDGMRPLWAHFRESMSAGRSFVRTRSGFSIVAGYAAMATGQGVLVLIWQPRVLGAGTISPSLLGLVLVALSVGAAIGSFGTRLFGGTDPRVLALSSIFLLAIGLGVASLDGQLYLVGFLLAELGLGACGAVLASMGQLRFPDELRNTLTSTVAAVFTIMVAFGQLVGGIVWGQGGFNAALLAGASIVAAIGCLMGVACRVDEDVFRAHDQRE